MIIFSMTLLIDLISYLVAGNSSLVVKTASGPVRGEILKTAGTSMEYAAFTNIRYGKAPLGYLRFKPPVPVEPWTEIPDATSQGNACPQLDITTNEFRGSEDCLFLDVYTPVTNLAEPPTKLKPVMVWIYGGSFSQGSKSNPLLQPDLLLEKDIVFVPINYRVGALGFLSLNHPNATGNAGLKDQVLALKWIQANIEKFGGNPKNVTLIGESSGAMAVGLHVLSEASAGLFHGTISMSGTPLVPWAFTSPAKAQNRAVNFASLLINLKLDKNVTLDKPRLLKALYEASPEELVENAQKIALLTPFAPTIEDPKIATDIFLSECPFSKYVAGNFTKVPQVLGFIEQETVSYLTRTNLFSKTVDQALDMSPSETLTLVKERLETDPNPWQNLNKTVIDRAVNETSILNFQGPIDITQKLLAAKNGNKPIYYYHTTFTTNTSLHNILQNSDFIGAGHGDDLAHIFYVPSADYSLKRTDPTGLTIYRVTTMMTNFAKYGNPTPDWIDEYPLGITWPTSGCAGRALNIGYDLTVEPRPIGLSPEVTDDLVSHAQTKCSFHTSMPKCSNNVHS